MSKAIGLDFGTKYCRVASLGRTQPELIPNPQQEAATPARLCLSRTGRLLVGVEAGSDRARPPAELLTDLKGRLASGQEVRLGGTPHPPTSLAARLLARLRQDAEQALRGPVSQVVVGVPALAGNRHRAATREAAALAGFKTVRLMNETTAAAVAHVLAGNANHRLLIYALGAGYFEVALVEVIGQAFRAVWNEGNNHLGGNTFDRKIVAYLLAQIKEQYGLDLSHDWQALQRLSMAAETAKIQLATLSETPLPLSDLGLGSGDRGPIVLDMTLSRANLDTLLGQQIEETVSLVRKALAQVKLTMADIDELLLMGGSTRLSLVPQKLLAAFDREPVWVEDDIVARGTAWQAASLEQRPPPAARSSSEPAGSRAPPVEREAAPAIKKPESSQTGPDRKKTASSNDQSIGPASFSSVLNQAQKLIEQTKIDRAIGLLQPLYQTDPANHQIGQLLAQAYHYRAIELVQIHRAKEALQMFKQALDHDPGNKKIRQNLIKVCLIRAGQLTKQGQWPQVIQTYEFALDHDSDNEIVLKKLVDACHAWWKRVRKQKQRKKAQAILRKKRNYRKRLTKLRSEKGGRG